MIARSWLPAEWAGWNGLNGAPYTGPYANFFGNCATRVWEYPWAFYAVPLAPGMAAIDIGGSLSGFAVSLAAIGLNVTVIDPDPRGLLLGGNLQGWAAQWGVRVESARTTVDRLDQPPESVDVAFCLSVIEHIADPAERAALMAGTWRLLKPGGAFVLTLDLRLDLFPFTQIDSKDGDRNIPVPELLDAAPFTLAQGIPTELYGMPGFSTEDIGRRAAAGEFLVANGCLLAQCMVLRKEAP